MKARRFTEKLFMASGALSAFGMLGLLSCQAPERPSNLNITEAEAQQLQVSRLEQTNQARKVVANLRKSLAPVEAILKDLSNLTEKVEARMGGKSLDNLHLNDGFHLLSEMLDKAYHSKLAKSRSDGSWAIRETLVLDSSTRLGNCSQVDVELVGKHEGNSDVMSLNLIHCGTRGSAQIADISVNQDEVRASLHLENLKDLSISTRAGAACSLQLSTTGGVLSSSLDCDPFTIWLGENQVVVSQLSITGEAKGVSGKVAVQAFDSNQKEIVAVAYPKDARESFVKKVVMPNVPAGGSIEQGGAVEMPPFVPDTTQYPAIEPGEEPGSAPGN
jgi:hypothetical protein